MHITVDTLADFFFPCQCSHCDVWDQTWLCSACASQLTLMQPSETHDIRCFSGLRALTQYSGIVKDIMHRAKYEDQPWRLTRFASAVARHLSDNEWLDAIDVVIPMPGDPWRTWKRGYNPARVIAHEVSKISHRPLAHPRAFTRTGSKPQQSLTMEERSSRYESNVFTVNKHLLGPSPTRKCLLVDDIATTGATIKAASDALVAYGLSVEVLVLSVGL
jgi:ComF family protein